MLHLDKQKFVGTRAAMSKKITASDAMHGGGEREVELPYETDGDGSREFRNRLLKKTNLDVAHMVGHSFQNYDRAYAGFSAAYTCLHTLRMGFKLIYTTV